jgi:peptide deformylase
MIYCSVALPQQRWRPLLATCTAARNWCDCRPSHGIVLAEKLMCADVKLIFYPDPRLKKMSRLVEAFDEALSELAARMLQIMREHRGVGLAAPQVGRNIRLFVVNATQQPGDDHAYANPELIDPTGAETSEEGCLSLPGINGEIERNQTVILRAQDLKGNPIEERASGYVARIWQHEIDHLNGVLITDRMGTTAKMMARRTLRELEEKFAEEHPASKTSKSKARR